MSNDSNIKKPINQPSGSIFRAINENKVILIGLGTFLMAVMPFVFQCIFPSLAFEDPSYVDVLLYGAMALVFVLFIMLSPGFFGYIFLFKQRKKKRNFKDIFHGKDIKRLVLEYYLPIISYIALIPFSIYTEFNGYGLVIPLAVYLLILIFFSWIKLLLNSPRLFTALKNKGNKLKFLTAILNKIFIAIFELMALSLIPLIIIFCVIALNDPLDMFSNSTEYLIVYFGLSRTPISVLLEH